MKDEHARLVERLEGAVLAANHNILFEAAQAIRTLSDELGEAKMVLKRSSTLLVAVGGWFCEEQPDCEFTYDGFDARSDAWGTGTDCENIAESINAFLNRGKAG